MLKTKKVGRPKRHTPATKPIFFSVRARDPEMVAHFKELCNRKGLNVNQAMLRLMGAAIFKEDIPAYIEKPRLPGYVPPREAEPQPIPHLED